VAKAAVIKKDGCTLQAELLSCSARKMGDWCHDGVLALKRQQINQIVCGVPGETTRWITHDPKFGWSRLEGQITYASEFHRVARSTRFYVFMLPSAVFVRTIIVPLYARTEKKCPACGEAYTRAL